MASNVTPEQLQQWKSRTCFMYLGDGITAECQVFCDKLGAELLRNAKFLHFDVSFKCTPKISPTAKESIPYKGALHLMASFPTQNPNETFATMPCATILYKDANPDADT